MRTLLLCTLIMLLGCAKNKSEHPGEFFIGKRWSGYVVNVDNQQDAQKLTVYLDSDIPKVEGEIIPIYKYILLSFEGENIGKGEMLITIHNSTPAYAAASILLNPSKNGAITATIDVMEKGKYQGTLYRISDSN